MISKIDSFSVKVAKVKDLNPLNSIEVQLELIHKDDSVEVDNQGALRIHENEIFPVIRSLFKGKFVNKNERFLLTFKEKNIILKG